MISDLRQRGMLDDTLVLFTSEFGRTPFTRRTTMWLGKGRDHNQFGIQRYGWRSGAQGGSRIRVEDEIGMRAVENVVHWPDFHATVLQLLGVDHEQLTFTTTAFSGD